jgi:HD-GYP domain-containing protein (c-di-GMP phosphodiesterase class II)
VPAIPRSGPDLPFRLQPRPWGRITERARASASNSEHSRRAGPFVLATGLLGALACWLLVLGDAPLTARGAQLAATLAALGLGSELLSFNQGKDAAGSIALIPLAATALVAPHSLTIILILGVELIVQSIHKRPWLKAAFNLAQITLGFALGIVAFRAAGGVPFTALNGESFLQCVRVELIPATLLVASVLLVNSLSVSGVVALTSGKSLLEVWSAYTKTTLRFSFLHVLVAFYLTWLSVNLGILGTAGMAIPIVAVRQLYRTTVELSTVTEELLDLMVAAIEARDPYTSGHSQRVARGSEVIARAMGLSPTEIERVTVAALLHDVGKIYAEFAPILAKEGRLTPEEWAVMKQHPIKSADLVGLLSSLHDVVKPVRHHHENWDGTGYPDGVRGEDIPLASRIIMFADTLDAITTDRPYRKALTLAEARAEFIKFRGRQFDPIICDRILAPSVWDELYHATDKGEEASQSISSVRRSHAS